jgi:hypothetical protein
MSENSLLIHMTHDVKITKIHGRLMKRLVDFFPYPPLLSAFFVLPGLPAWLYKEYASSEDLLLPDPGKNCSFRKTKATISPVQWEIKTGYIKIHQKIKAISTISVDADGQKMI